METFSALLALCAGNSSVTGEFPQQRPVMWSFDVFFDLRVKKRLSKHSWGWWFETPSCPLWRHCSVKYFSYWKGKSLWSAANKFEMSSLIIKYSYYLRWSINTYLFTSHRLIRKTCLFMNLLSEINTDIVNFRPNIIKLKLMKASHIIILISRFYRAQPSTIWFKYNAFIKFLHRVFESISYISNNNIFCCFQISYLHIHI